MDPISLITGVGIGAGITAVLFHFRVKQIIARHRNDIRLFTDAMKINSKRLTNLRRNAYLTNELGHRVRYSKASAEVRARAEAE